MKRIILAVCVVLLMVFSASAEGFTAVSAGGAHALAVDERGNAWAWGSNVRGESVPGEAGVRVTEPVKVLENVVSVACGRDFSLALTSDGALYGWGDNRSGQLPGVSEARPAAPVLLWEGVLSMDACESRAVLVTTTGAGYAWGAGEAPRLLCDNVAEAAVGLDFILIRLKNGGVYEYPDGEDESDSLNRADDENSADRLRAGEPETRDESSPNERPKGVKKLAHATGIDACGQTRMAQTEDGTLYSWGAAGNDGRLGLAVSGWLDAPTPLALTDVRAFSAGLTSSGAVTQSGEAYLWGTLYSYVVIYDEAGDPAASVVDGPLVSYGNAPVRLYENAKALAFGDAFALLLRTDGTVFAWGSNDHGQMADGDWTKAELADSDDEEEKDVVITESDQFVFPAVISLPGDAQ